jgi:hypothetical protein
MLFYIAQFIAITVISFFYSKSKDLSVRIISQISVFLLMFLPAALRYGVGTDYFNYVRIYNSLNVSSAYVEYGFYMLNVFLYENGWDVQWIFAIMAFLILLFLFLSVSRKSFYIIIPFYMTFFYSFSFNIIRQALVVSMVYYAFVLFNKKRLFASLAILVAGSLFHVSALLFIPLFLVLSIVRITKRRAVILLVLVLASTFFSNTIIEFIFNKIVSYTDYTGYITSSVYNSKTEMGTGIGVGLRYLMMVIIIITFYNKTEKESSNVLTAFLVYIFTDCLGIQVTIFLRLSFGFSFIWLPVIDFINAHSTKYRKIIVLSLFFWTFIVLIANYRNNMNAMIPYKTIFSKY